MFNKNLAADRQASAAMRRSGTIDLAREAMLPARGTGCGGTHV
jgi:hypothetical protein